MGTSENIHPTITMKACLVLLLAVAANAQYFGFNYPYATTYSNYGYGTAFPYSYNNIYHSLGKLEAEAEPAHFYSAMPYYHHTPYAAAYKPITYAAAYKPVSYYKPMHMQAKTYSNDAMKPMGYAAKGMYHAESAGAHHYGKRDAEAEPQYVYSSGVHYPMTYSLHNYGYTHYPYTTAYSHISKREAEAEFYNSFYGNHAFTYGAYPYTYSGYNYPSYY